MVIWKVLGHHHLIDPVSTAAPHVQIPEVSHVMFVLMIVVVVIKDTQSSPFLPSQ